MVYCCRGNSRVLEIKEAQTPQNNSHIGVEYSNNSQTFHESSSYSDMQFTFLF